MPAPLQNKDFYDWYGVKPGEYFIKGGRSGGLASNLTEAPDETIFQFADIKGLDPVNGQAYSGYFKKQGRSLLPISDKEAKQSDGIEYIDAPASLANQVGFGIRPIGSLVTRSEENPVTGASPSLIAEDFVSAPGKGNLPAYWEKLGISPSASVGEYRAAINRYNQQFGPEAFEAAQAKGRNLGQQVSGTYDYVKGRFQPGERTVSAPETPDMKIGGDSLAPAYDPTQGTLFQNALKTAQAGGFLTNTAKQILARSGYNETGQKKVADGSLPAPRSESASYAAGSNQPTGQPGTTGTGTPLSNPSIVDYLNSVGQPSDYNSRARLAQERGITGYMGTAAQNTRLLGMLRAEQTAAAAPKPKEEPIATKPTGDQPVLNPQAEKDGINEKLKGGMEEKLKTIQEKTDKVDLSDSAELVADIKAMLADKKTEEKPKTLAETYADLKAKFDKDPDVVKLSQIDAEIKKFDDDWLSTVEAQENRRVSMGVINRNLSEGQMTYNRKRRELIQARDAVADQVSSKLSTLNTIMTLTGQDYDNARQDYQQKFSNAIALTNLVQGIEDRAKTDQERRQDNARAMAQVIYNTIKERNADYASLPASMKLAIKTIETQAGLPAGFIKYIKEKIKDPVISIQAARQDLSGNWFTTVVTVDKNTGEIKTEKVDLGIRGRVPGTGGGGGGKKSTSEKSEVDSLVEAIDSLFK